MKILVTLLWCIPLISTANLPDSLVDVMLSNPKFKHTNIGSIIPGRYIIEFADHFQGSSLEFVQDIESDIISAKPMMRMNIAHDYGSPIFRGISISFDLMQQQNQLEKREEVDDEGGTAESFILSKILQHHRVKHIYPVTEIERPKVTRHDFGSFFDNRSDVPPSIPVIDLKSNTPSLPFSYSLSQIDKVHKELKLMGKGITIGIIDSGIDYHHKAFGGGFGPGYKVQYGYDLVGDEYDSLNPQSIKTSGTPLDSCLNGNGHGTHVAGIIGADDKYYNFTGVAPEATLGVWRVFGCTGSTSNDLVMKAMIDAHEIGCDIINLSLGTANNWPEDASAVVAERIANSGVIVISASGNDGEKGAFYISSPGSSPKSVSVASVDNLLNLERVLVTEDGSKYGYKFSPETDLFPEGTAVLFSVFPNHADACNGHIPTQFLFGHIVVVQRGGCTFKEKAKNVKKLGGIGMIIYNNEDVSSFKPIVGQGIVPVAAISKRAGVKFRKEIFKHFFKKVKISFKYKLEPTFVETANQSSPFSSVGPLYDMSLKPNIAGVGGYVFSTLPKVLGSYGILSGTSMSAPYISGAYALYLQQLGKKDPTYIMEHFQNYAKPASRKRHIENPAIQGAGLIQVYDAIKEKVHISPGQISFNDTDNISDQYLTIFNPGDKTEEFTIKTVSSLPLAPFDLKTGSLAPIEPITYASKAVAATVEISKNHIVLNPGQKTTIRLRVTGVSDSDPNQPFPIYGGFIEFIPVSGSSHPGMNVPYIGIKGSLKNLSIFDKNFPRLISQPTKSVLQEESLKDPKLAQFSIDRTLGSSSYVIVGYRLLMGTKMLRMEVLDKNQKYLGLANKWDSLSRNTKKQPNEYFTTRWNGTVMPNGSEDLNNLRPLKLGTYYLRWKALRLLSNPNQPDSWETVMSSPVHIVG